MITEYDITYIYRFIFDRLAPKLSDPNSKEEFRLLLHSWYVRRPTCMLSLGVYLFKTVNDPTIIEKLTFEKDWTFDKDWRSRLAVMMGLLFGSTGSLG